MESTISGSTLNNSYKMKSKISYQYALQSQNMKTISTIEHDLMNACDSMINLKFDSRLEPTKGSMTEIGKEQFVALLKRKVEEHGQETFYVIKGTDRKVVDLFEHSHYYKLDAVIVEYECCSDLLPATVETFDSYEIDEITLS